MIDNNIRETVIRIDETCYNVLFAVVLNLLESNPAILSSWHITDATRFLTTPAVNEFLMHMEILHNDFTRSGRQTKNDVFKRRYEMIANSNNLKILVSDILACIYQTHNSQ